MNRRRTALIGLLLIGATLALYWPVRHFEFVDYDDNILVTDNEVVKSGLNWASAKWALTTPVVAIWHPLTTLSHMLDCQLFGVQPGPAHMVNACLHAANALLLFLALRRLTGTTWRSAIVAGIFALHPLRVESVAWISERKDVLSGFFFMLTLWAWGGAVSSRGKTVISNQSSVWACGQMSKGWYVLAILFFALGLMSKPMLVTVPFVLLLLDYWPLGGRRAGWRRLIVEKWPFFGLSALFSFLTFYFQRTGTAVVSMERVGLDERLANAVVSYLRYLGKFFWPTDLAAIYPHPSNPFPLVDRWAGWQVALGAVALVGITLFCVLKAGRWMTASGANATAPNEESRSAPHGPTARYLIVGWLWFMGTLVPVIGLVQVGGQAMADRYTYIPLIGVSIAVVWGVAELLGSKPAMLIANQGSEGERKTASHEPGVLAHKEIPLTTDPDSKGRLSPNPSPPEGERGDRSPKPKGESVRGQFGLGGFLAVASLVASAAVTHHQLGYWHDTIRLFEHTIAVTADNPDAHFGLGIGLQRAGLTNQAMMEYRVAVKINPALAEAHYNTGQLLREQGKLEDAAREYENVLETYPDHYFAHFNLAGVYWLLGRRPEAIAQMEAALRSDPASADALNNLAWWLAAGPDPQYRDGARAVELAERACQATGYKKPLMIGTLAAAYAESGRFNEAVAAAERAKAVAEQDGETAIAARNWELREVYRAGKAYHEEPSKAPKDAKDKSENRNPKSETNSNTE